MIIGIDASRANHDKKTGVEWYTWHMIEELKTLVPNTDRVVLYSDTPLTGDIAKLPPHWESRVLGWPPKKRWTQIRFSWEMFRRPPDVLFVPAHVLPLIHPKKTVLTIHDVAGAYFPKAYSRFERWYSVWSATFALRKQAQVIVPTEHVRSDLIRLTKKPERVGQITVVPHGVDPSFGVPHSEEEKKRVRSTYHLPETYILFAGRLEEKKNVAGLIRVYNAFRQKYPEQKEALVLIGKPGFGYDAVKKEIDHSPFKKDIFELGWVSAEDLPVLFQATRAFVFLSWYEGFGIPLLEAFQSGVPVLSSNRSCLPEVGGEACVFIDPKDEGCAVDSLYTLLTSEEMRQKYTQAGFSRVREFDWKKSAMQTLRVIRSA